jgi:hypothetical protein
MFLVVVTIKVNRYYQLKLMHLFQKHPVYKVQYHSIHMIAFIVPLTMYTMVQRKRNRRIL